MGGWQLSRLLVRIRQSSADKTNLSSPVACLKIIRILFAFPRAPASVKRQHKDTLKKMYLSVDWPLPANLSHPAARVSAAQGQT
jgi:hypothetical protein